MRVLFLAPYPPWPPVDGGRIRMYQLMSRLAARHEVHVLALGEPDVDSAGVASALRAQGVAAEIIPHRMRPARSLVRALLRGRSLYACLFWSRQFADVVDRRLAGGGYDLVQAEFPYMVQYRRRPTPPWVLDEHNVESRINETLTGPARSLARLPYRLYARRERRLRGSEELAACRRVEHVVTVSYADRDRLEPLLPGAPLSVVPNGVDLDHYLPAPAPAQGRGGVFIGKMDYRPNVEGVVWFCRSVLPLIRASRPDFTLTIVGSHPVSAVRALESLPGVRVTGGVADTRPYLRDAAVAVVPLHAGSGTRLKILEALAMAQPVVTTPLGAEGLSTVHGVHVRMAVDAPAFADEVLRVLEDPRLAVRLGEAGRRLVEREYGWGGAADRLADVFERVDPLTRARRGDR